MRMAANHLSVQHYNSNIKAMNATKISLLTLAAQALIFSTFGQGWTADVYVYLNHDRYALEKISTVTFSYSGVSASASSLTGGVEMTIHGTGSITGSISVSASGVAWERYDTSVPESTSISGSYNGNFTGYCTRTYFQKQGSTSDVQIFITITVYPRMVITGFDNQCDLITLTTSTCSSSYTWEVSESLAADYIVLAGKTSATVSLTSDEIMALGFSKPFGRKYFRVTGRMGTTSQVQPVDIFYPPPVASFALTPPRCRDSKDGSVVLDIRSADATVINDFVATLFADENLTTVVEQQFVNDGSGITFSLLGPGQYWVKIENNSNISVYGNCWAVYNVGSLPNPSPPVITLEQSDYNGYAVSCYGGRNGKLTATVSGGTGDFIGFEWLPNVSTTRVAANLAAGTYQVRAMDSNHCWTDPVVKTLTSPAQLSIDLTSTGGKNGFDVTCADKTDGAIRADVTGGAGGYLYRWANGSTLPVLTGLAAGTYALKITDGNGCAGVDSIALKAPKPIDFSIAEIAGINCPNDQSGALEVRSPVNTIGQIYYLWSSGEVSKDVAGKNAGTYAVTVSDDQGCSTTHAHTVQEAAPWSLDIVPVSDFNGVPIRCHGESNGVLFMRVKDDDGNIVAADHYTWYKDGREWVSGPDRASLTGVAAGTYRGEIFYRNTCKAEETFTVNDPAALVAAISSEVDYHGKEISCAGEADGSIRADVTGGTGEYTFTWNTGKTVAVITGLSAGHYAVSVLDENGCEATAEKFLQEPAPVEARISVPSDFNGQALSCAGTSDATLRVSAKGGTPPFSYSWNTQQNVAELTGVPAGYYAVNTIDLNGCTVFADTTLADPEPVTARISAHSDYHGFGVSCHGSQDGYLLCEADGGTGTFTYSLEGSALSGPLYENLGPSTYMMTAKDANGCAGVVLATLTEPPLLLPEISAIKNISCYGGSDGAIALRASGGTGEYAYALDGGTWQASAGFAGLKAGTFTLKVKDANQCIDSVLQTLVEPQKLAISFDAIASARCGDPTGRVSAVVTGGTGTYTYQWSDFQGEMAGSAATVSGLSSGIYTVKVTDGHGCEAAKPVGITSIDGPKISLADVHAPSCSYSSDGSVELDIADGSGPFTFLWDDGQKTKVALDLKGGDHLVEITDANLCTVVETVRLTAPDPLEIDLAEKTIPSCYGDCNGTISVLAKGGNGNYSYMWENFQGPLRTGLCAGKYTVTVTDSKQCISSKMFILEQPETLAVHTTVIDRPTCRDGCDGEIAVTSSGGTGNLQYEWSDGQRGPRIAGLCAGSYTVTSTDVNGCRAEKTFALLNPAGTAPDLGGPVTLCRGQTFTLDAGPQWKSYSWSDHDGIFSTARIVTLSEAGTYWLDVINEKGCQSRDTFLLETSTDLLRANFLLTAQAMEKDTVVAIDISWPLPEDIRWTFPPEMERLRDEGDVVYGKFAHAGRYEVSLEAVLGQCHDEISKSVEVIQRRESAFDEGRRRNERYVKQFNLYPNPNEGVFDVEIEFIDESPMMLTVLNPLTGTKIGRVQDSGQARYTKHIDLGPLAAGTYTLRLDYREGVKYLRFIVR